MKQYKNENLDTLSTAIFFLVFYSLVLVKVKIFETVRQIDIFACNISNVITYFSFPDKHESIAMNKPIPNERSIFFLYINKYVYVM